MYDEQRCVWTAGEARRRFGYKEAGNVGLITYNADRRLGWHREPGMGTKKELLL